AEGHATGGGGGGGGGSWSGNGAGGRRSAERHRRRPTGRLLNDRVLLNLELQVEEVADRLLLDAVHHRVEHVVALPLVLDQRVALRHRAPADAPAGGIHLVQGRAP